MYSSLKKWYFVIFSNIKILSVDISLNLLIEGSAVFLATCCGLGLNGIYVELPAFVDRFPNWKL